MSVSKDAIVKMDARLSTSRRQTEVGGDELTVPNRLENCSVSEETVNTKISYNNNYESMSKEEAPKPRLKELNPFISCGICNGYLVDAFTILECLHSYCKSCIVKYMESSDRHCPKCIEEDKSPLSLKQLTILRDDTLQSLTYKMVPGLFRNERKRRERFHTEKDIEPSDTEHEEFFSPDDLISLSLEYKDIPSDNAVRMERTAVRRYLQCPAAVTIGQLKKLLRLKYDLLAHMQIEMFYEDDSVLSDSLSLVDVVYILGWDKKSPMRLLYCFYRKVVSKVTVSELSIVVNHIEEPPKDTSNGFDSPVEPVLVVKRAETESTFDSLKKSTESSKKIVKLKVPTRSVTVEEEKCQVTFQSTVKQTDKVKSAKSKINDCPKQVSEHKNIPKSNKQNQFIKNVRIEIKPCAKPALKRNGYLKVAGSVECDNEDKCKLKDNMSHMQPRVDLTEYARNIGLTAVRNGSHFDFGGREDSDVREATDKEQFEFARKRDREWAAQKQQDEKNTKDETHKKRKKTKHPKNEESSKRRKLHAEITSPESEETLKLKVKLTPTNNRHKHHKNHNNTAISSLDESTAAASLQKEMINKEKLLQMRAVRKDKHTSLNASKQHVGPALTQLTQVPLSIPNLIPATTIDSSTRHVKFQDHLQESRNIPLNKSPIAATQNPVLNANGKRSLSDMLGGFQRMLNIENKRNLEPPNKPLPMLMPPSSLSVTKMSDGQLTAAVTKPVDKRPNLEIMLINASEKDNTTLYPTSPKSMRPPPPTIPLVRIKKSAGKLQLVSKEPRISDKKPNEVSLPVQNISVNIDPKPMCDKIGALDLSGKSSRSPNSEAITNPVSPSTKSNSPKPVSGLSNNRLSNGGLDIAKKSDKPLESNHMSNLRMLSESAVHILMRGVCTTPAVPSQVRAPTSAQTSLRIPMLRPAFKAPHVMKSASRALNPVPRLNEIKGPRCMAPRPQNQTVRSIPNPSALSCRQNQGRPLAPEVAKQENSQNASAPMSSPSATGKPNAAKPNAASNPSAANNSNAASNPNATSNTKAAIKPSAASSPLPVPPPFSSFQGLPTDIMKMENLAKNIHIEQVTAGLAVRASEATSKDNIAGPLRISP